MRLIKVERGKFRNVNVLIKFNFLGFHLDGSALFKFRGH